MTARSEIAIRIRARLQACHKHMNTVAPSGAEFRNSSFTTD